MKIHRNTQKRFIHKDAIYFVTTKTFGNFPFFQNKMFCELFIKELELCKKLKHFELYAFCLNHDHFHLVLKPDNKVANISQVMKFLKQHSSWNLNVILGFNKHTNEGGVGQPRLQGGKLTTKNQLSIKDNWKQMFDKNIIDPLQKQFVTKYGTNPNLPQFKWQLSFHDHVIRNQKDMREHISYTATNFHKHDLPYDWNYTSLNLPKLIDSYSIN